MTTSTRATVHAYLASHAVDGRVKMHVTAISEGVSLTFDQVKKAMRTLLLDGSLIRLRFGNSTGQVAAYEIAPFAQPGTKRAPTPVTDRRTLWTEEAVAILRRERAVNAPTTYVRECLAAELGMALTDRQVSFGLSCYCQDVERSERPWTRPFGVVAVPVVAPAQVAPGRFDNPVRLVAKGTFPANRFRIGQHGR